MSQSLHIGLDVGSTTVKAVVLDATGDTPLWSDYRRHETRQPEVVLEMLASLQRDLPEVSDAGTRLFVTGSGGAPVAAHLGGHVVQEVHAVSFAAERLHPAARSVVELGGQDAKIIIFREDPLTGIRRKHPTMNDKCAGGTGAVIDKIAAKLGLAPGELATMPYRGVRTHPVAGKCGVFAETDINSLQKLGTPAGELVASLYDALVLQNLSVLTRGHTLRPQVLLLGGPNHFLHGLQECWRHHIAEMWEEREIGLPEGTRPEDQIVVPANAPFYAAMGAVFCGRDLLVEHPGAGAFRGTERLQWYVSDGRPEGKRSNGTRGLSRDDTELREFLTRYQRPDWSPPRPGTPGETVEVILGLDGGSTSTKAVLLDLDGRVMAKAYQLSLGNPIDDTRQVLTALHGDMLGRGWKPLVRGAATTGYAKDILKDVIGADLALVETVAHARSGLHVHPEADVICDVGGQDIKILLLKDGHVRDFRLNTQCSAGNGYYLQATAAAFDVPVEAYAETAFSAREMPLFGYGCAVFMQTDIVDFQRQGWKPREILAGLAAVLPKNIWHYVCQIPNLPKLGSVFVLQGGTQRNLAAVKAQTDFIAGRFAGTGITPRVLVHEHCGEAGAIGCALEALRVHAETGADSTFIGFAAAAGIAHRTLRDESTRCTFCRNQCMRTFIDVTTPAVSAEGVDVSTHPYRVGATEEHPSRMKHGLHGQHRLPQKTIERRLIVATCEKGTVENIDDMRGMQHELDAACAANPNLAEYTSRAAFEPVPGYLVTPATGPDIWKRLVSGGGLGVAERRAAVRIAMPRVLNLYGMAPFFMGYFQSLGVPAANLLWSGHTSDQMYREGARRGSIDPCFPSKVCIPHVASLLRDHDFDPFTHLFFPMILTLPPTLADAENCWACPTCALTPEAVHAAFLRERDLFAEAGVAFVKPVLHLHDRLLCAREMAWAFGSALALGEGESRRAVDAGLRALAHYLERLQDRAREVIDMLEREDRIGIVLLARPYHSDPGIHHGICDAFQRLGYPVLTQDSLPTDKDTMERLFGEEVDATAEPLSIRDVWKKSFSENSSRKVWAAKFAARHPNLVPVELSNFKCGHDAPLYGTIERIVQGAGKPFFSFRDIDENKPAGSVRIRIETIAYFLRRYHEKMLSDRMARAEVEERLKDYEARLRRLACAGDGNRDEAV